MIDFIYTLILVCIAINVLMIVHWFVFYSFILDCWNNAKSWWFHTCMIIPGIIVSSIALIISCFVLI